MAGLVPAIHVLLTVIKKDVDAQHKAGHDESIGAMLELNLNPMKPCVPERQD
jgi:hypothetical protein